MVERTARGIPVHDEDIQRIKLQLDTFERLFAKGQKAALICTIEQCAKYGLVLPKWSVTAILQGFHRIYTFKLKSWDDVFGAPHSKNTRPTLAKRRLRMRWRVRHEILKLRRTEKAKINPELFGRVAKSLSIGRRQCKEYWYSFAPHMRDSSEDLTPPSDEEFEEMVAKDRLRRSGKDFR